MASRVIILQKIILIIIISTFKLAAQNSTKMEAMLEERRLLYTDWKERLEHKSGLFGNQTKSDLVEINSALKQIIKKDNEILEYLKDEKSTEYQHLQEKYNSILEENEQLANSKKAFEKNLFIEKKYQKENHSKIQREEGDKIFIGILLFLAILLIWILSAKLRKSLKKLKALEIIVKNSTKS